MFRPSQSLLFRPTPALLKFILHPPLPLNPRESKQLLNLLSTSFRQALDREHLIQDDYEATKIATQTSTKHNDTPRGRRPSTTDAGLNRPTDRHMHSILTNPLFNWSSAPQKAKKFAKDPMEVFDMAVAKGMMTTSSALGCLEAKKRQIIKSAHPSVREGLRASGAGRKVLRWLVSSGTANDNDFLLNGKFAYLLMEYLVAEDLQEVAWTWMRRGFEKYSHTSHLSPLERKAVKKVLLNPLMALIHAEAQSPANLDAAYQCLSRAVGYFEELPAHQVMHLLHPPLRFLLSRTITPVFHQPPASESAFDSFVALVPRLSSRHIGYHLAYLSLLHPTRPSADLALSFVKSLDCSYNRSFSPSHGSTIQISLDAAKFLLEQERLEDAMWIMQYLRTTYPDRLG